MTKTPRTMVQRAKDIYRYIDQNQISYEEIPKSHFQKVGISPREMENWIELLTLIQDMPRIHVRRKGSRTYINTQENKFMLLMKKKYFDQKLNYLERESAILLYFKALLAIERLIGDEIKIEDIIEDNWKIDRPTIKRLAEDVIQFLNK